MLSGLVYKEPYKIPVEHDENSPFCWCHPEIRCAFCWTCSPCIHGTDRDEVVIHAQES